jgi:hypothetical protein
LDAITPAVGGTTCAPSERKGVRATASSHRDVRIVFSGRMGY